MRLSALLLLTACAPASAPPSNVVLAPAASAESKSPTPSAPVATDCTERRTLAQAEVDAALSDPEHAMRLARLVPVQRDGGYSFRLFGIKSDSTLDRWGLRNGDEIVTLNGRALDTPEMLLEAYTDARQRPVLELAVVRNGQPMTLCYPLER